MLTRLVIGTSRTVGSAKKFVRITSGFGGGEFTKMLRKVCTCQKLKFSFLLLEYCKNQLFCLCRLPAVLLLRQSLLRLLILRQWPIVCNSGAFRNPNAVRDCPFNLKGAWFLSWSRKFFSYAALLFLKLFSATQQNIFYKRKYYFMVTVEVLRVGVMIVGVISVGVLSVGVMTLSYFFNQRYNIMW
jgi:hypothetical protein